MKACYGNIRTEDLEDRVTRTIEVPISDELLKLVDEKARTRGLKREDFIRAVLSRE